ncbi:unnamed protein product [Plutella xylostella]|uniref:(diamondback moth) hypothetical protein n=1 Tax=Plutella xylostella TaxID=51655 RepID=A0A8S4D8N6_PLUXY|nr:unnamed protein product [Plutella xylostella]
MLQILSRSKPAADYRSSSSGSSKKSFPELEDFILKRDYIGALTLLEFLKNDGNKDIWLEVWAAWCWFHLGEYRSALDAYLRVQGRAEEEARVADHLPIDIAVCYFYLGMYKESQEMADKAANCALKSRLQLHLAHSIGDSAALLAAHGALRDTPDDQLCLASAHYLRAHYQEAVDVYKKLLLDKRASAALLAAHGALRDTPDDQLCLASAHYLRAHYQEAVDVYKKLLLDKRSHGALRDTPDDQLCLASAHYQEAVDVYKKLLLDKRDSAALLAAHGALRDTPDDQLCLASAHYLRAHYQEAVDVYKKLLLDKRDSAALLAAHGALRDTPDDQLCLASAHYLRAHYQEAVDVYKKLLLDKRSYVALNVYVALCYYKLDYYDVSQEVLGVLLAQHPDSTVAGNLKACNLFRLYNGKAAEAELKQISSDQHTFGQDLVKHNLVVFRNGEGALKVLPQLVDVVPEARLNLAGYHLRRREPLEARRLLEPVQPTSPLHYILRAVVAVRMYNETGDEEHMKTAQQSFHAVGSSPSECDTIPGRQCMASSYFLAAQHEEVLLYLNSIKSFFVNDDTFNFNYAQAKVATGFYREAEECLLAIQDETIRASYTYLACLARCHVMNKDADHAWDICVKSAGTPDSFALLQLVANDSYRMGQFLVAAKAFHMLDRLDGGPEMWEGLRGAVCGCAQMAAAGKQGAAAELREALGLLRGPRAHPRAEHIVKPIMKWAQQNRIAV